MALPDFAPINESSSRCGTSPSAYSSWAIRCIFVARDKSSIDSLLSNNIQAFTVMTYRGSLYRTSCGN